jgi:PPOX class probable F420-dependent enzyme
MEITEALERTASHKNATLITLRRDGRAQSSDIVFAVVGDTIKISVTHDRAKTRNLQRDSRAVFHLSDPSSWSYLSIDAIADVSAVTTAADDKTADELVAIYRIVAGEHDNWDEFRAAMVGEGRCVITLSPQSVTGQMH